MAIATTLPKLLKQGDLHPEIRLVSEKELASKLDTIDKASEFLIEQHRLASGHGRAHLITAINCGRLLIIQKKEMSHGEFRTWAERGCGLKAWNVTRYMRLAKLAEKFGANVEKMSANAVMRLEKQPSMTKEDIRKAREKKGKKHSVDQYRTEFGLLADRVDTALADNKQIFGEVLVPRLRAALREYAKTAERQKAVRE